MSALFTDTGAEKLANCKRGGDRDNSKVQNCTLEQTSLEEAAKAVGVSKRSVSTDTGELLTAFHAARERLDRSTALLAWGLDLRDCMATFDVARRLDHAEVRHEVDTFRRAVAAHRRRAAP